LDRDACREDLLRFLTEIQRPGRPIAGIDESESLVEAGLIDSLALMQIVSYLEETYGIDFAESGLEQGDLGSIQNILALIERRTAG